ncbi:MAG: VOC family protein [Oscillospiraceae bacterium]|nr:VOC family protein [Oscillospiraceae bacterium]
MKRSMMQVYVKNSDTAVSFYQSVFGANVLCDHRHENGTVAHAELDIYGQVLAVCETLEPEVETGNSMQFCLHFGAGKEELVREIIEKLSAGGTFTYHGPTDWSPLMAGIRDQFGVNWCVFV